jgi:alpha-beta hydrolase superfamily lysophospholipase
MTNVLTIKGMSMNIGPLRVLAVQAVDVTASLRHVEIYTTSGLVTLLWHGPENARNVVLAVGGAMGGLLGPADGFYQHLGESLGEQGIGTVRVSYRRPNDLDACIADTVAAAMLAERSGAERFITMGHSFGGAVAIGAALPDTPISAQTIAVCTLATQSAGCERAAALGGRPLLLVHGDADEILPVWSSEAVHQLAGGRGRLEVLAGAGHLLREHGASDWLRQHVPAWIVEQFAAI